MKRYRACLVPALLVALTGACDILDMGEECKEYAGPGIVLSFVDSVTAQPPTSGAGVAVARAGGYRDISEVAFPAPTGQARAGFAQERPGTYRVDVLVSGYRYWYRNDVRVVRSPNECHVQTVELTVKLQPAR